MSEWSPPAISRPWLVAIGLGYALVLAYSIVIVHQILLGIFLGFLIASLYLLWRFIAAFEAIADAQQRIARQRERE